jgi:hypothetical protein
MQSLEFVVHGPFDIPLDAQGRDLVVDGFWETDPTLERLAEGCGCCVLALASVKG